MMLLVTREIPQAVAERAAVDFTVRHLAHHGAFAPELVLRNAEGVAAILCTPIDRFDAALIARLPDSVRVIATFSVGIEHLDVAAAAARGITICHTPDVLSTATAELALTLMLMAARRAGEGERLLRAGRWQGFSTVFQLGHGVVGKSLGIFGMGRIGRELAAMARGLRMTVHYRNRTRLSPELEAGAIYHGDDAGFLGAVDFLSINAPGGAETRHWLNADRIALLRPGAIVVNTGRGSTVDDAALIAALRGGHLAAAGLDVFNNEPQLDPAYLTLENAVLLPHIGSATVETRDAMGFLALDGIRKALQG
ncbi:MAG: D-glycerate dehydrogenase [Acidocella sp. 20-63-7]|nr:MAG: D-glycerate dehydrogenase [Acidocella sp. 20-63-7]HQT47340.1 D-glycerate dehydrogenase [Acidocella sp.]